MAVLDILILVTCPHCLGAGGDCCVCRGRGRLHTLDAERAATWSWARVDCQCRTCGAVGFPPDMVVHAVPRVPIAATPKPSLGQGPIPWRFAK
jgi:hypothetical protein